MILFRKKLEFTLKKSKWDLLPQQFQQKNTLLRRRENAREHTLLFPCVELFNP